MHSAVGFARAFVEGVDGPVLRATKNRRSYRVAIDSGTLGVLADHWRRSVVAAERGGVGLTVESFVFSRDCDGVQRDARRVSFGRGWVQGEEGAAVVAPTKTKRRHSVELSANTHRVLLAVGGDGVSGFVFSDDGGVTAWEPNWVTKTFVRYRRAAGVGEFQLRDLRHFMATEMLNAGVPLPVVARRLDHQRPSTTLNFYADAVPGGDAEVECRGVV